VFPPHHFLLFWGPESWTSNPDLDGRAETMRDHKTIVFQEAGHWLHHDQPEDFMRDLRAFLQPLRSWVADHEHGLADFLVGKFTETFVAPRNDAA
jgi:hypothetical protein